MWYLISYKCAWPSPVAPDFYHSAVCVAPFASADYHGFALITSSCYAAEQLSSLRVFRVLLGLAECTVIIIQSLFLTIKYHTSFVTIKNLLVVIFY
jgi:hypothetical protein